jgi:tripartite-type tricarboxylate transporter receptor subunit TctC
MKLVTLFATAATSAVLAGVPAVGMAQSYPNKVVKIVVPFPPGSPGDFVVRLLSEKLQANLKQSFIVENRPGAGGTIGSELVAKSPPDGYTLLEGPDTILTVNPVVYKKLAFQASDLVPLTYLANFSQMLVCHPAVKAKNLRELLALAKKEKITSASGGNGVPGHLALELLKTSTGVDFVHVPYKGPSPAVQDLLGGQVQCGFLASPVVGPHVKSGKLVAFAVSGTKRSAIVPEVPTAAEAGVPGYDATFAEMLFVPKATPDSVTRTLHEEIAKALQQPDVREKMLGQDLDPVGSTPAESMARMQRDADKWGKVVRQINLQLD